MLSILLWNCNEEELSVEAPAITPENYLNSDHLVFSNFESDTIHLKLVRDIAEVKASYYLNHDSLSIDFAIKQMAYYSGGADKDYEWTVMMNDSGNPLSFPDILPYYMELVLLQEQNSVTYPEYHFFNESITLNNKEFSNVFSVYDTENGFQHELHYSLNQGLLGFKQNNTLWTLED